MPGQTSAENQILLIIQDKGQITATSYLRQYAGQSHSAAGVLCRKEGQQTQASSSQESVNGSRGHIHDHASCVVLSEPVSETSDA